MPDERTLCTRRLAGVPLCDRGMASLKDQAWSGRMPHAGAEAEAKVGACLFGASKAVSLVATTPSSVGQARGLHPEQNKEIA